LDIWIEGPSGGEPTGHQSINAGDPNGAYESYSYAINNGGMVYNDQDKGGEIEKYMQSTPEQDKAAVQALKDAMEIDNERIYGFDTCRTYSQGKFELFKNIFKLEESTPPTRSNTPRSLPRKLTGPTTAIPYSTTSSTGTNTSR